MIKYVTRVLIDKDIIFMLFTNSVLTFGSISMSTERATCVAVEDAPLRSTGLNHAWSSRRGCPPA